MSAAEQPLSTLSADADTASYANLRRLVRSGAGLGTIDPGAVRIEEMLNYFDYDYAAPAEGEDFALTARAGACPWNAESELVVLGLTVGQAVTEAPPTNLVLLVDVSGSMGDAEKLPLLKESMARIVRGLRAEDRVSIVTYSGVEEVVLKGASGDDAEAILGAINGLEAAGSTNGEAGLSMAYRVAEETHIEGGDPQPAGRPPHRPGLARRCERGHLLRGRAERLRQREARPGYLSLGAGLRLG